MTAVPKRSGGEAQILREPLSADSSAGSESGSPVEPKVSTVFYVCRPETSSQAGRVRTGISELTA